MDENQMENNQGGMPSANQEAPVTPSPEPALAADQAVAPAPRVEKPKPAQERPRERKRQSVGIPVSGIPPLTRAKPVGAQNFRGQNVEKREKRRTFVAGADSPITPCGVSWAQQCECGGRFVVREYEQRFLECECECRLTSGNQNNRRTTPGTGSPPLSRGGGAAATAAGRPESRKIKDSG